VNIFKRKINYLRDIFSTYFLDFSENENSNIFKLLIKNQSLKNILFYLNDMRKGQREKAKKDLQDKQIPDNVLVKLDSLVYAIPLEYESFKIVDLFFQQLKTENESTYNSIQSIIENKNNKDFKCICRFGTIGGEINRFRHSKIRPLKNIPRNVKNIEFSYTRILPSFAIVILKFNFLENVTKEIRDIQSKDFLSKISFKKFFPLTKLQYNQIESWGQETKKAIDQYKSLLKEDIKKWTSLTFKIKYKDLENSFFMDVYNVFGNPKSEEELKLWLKQNKQWLNDFDFSNAQFFEKEGFFTHYSQNSIISFEPFKRDINRVITGKRIDDEILSRVITKSFNSIINKYQLELEELRTTVFKGWLLFNSDTKRLTMIITLLNRLREELKQNKKYIKNNIYVIGTPKNIYNDNIEHNPTKKIVKNIFRRLKEIQKDLEILDNGINKILSISNTKAILWLTIIMSILTAFSVYGTFNQSNLNTTEMVENKK
jgi:hypothetical protein